MIVVDTTVIAYFWIPGDFQRHAQELFSKDPNWITVPLWKSEFRNVLRNYCKRKIISKEKAIEILVAAEEQMVDKERPAASLHALELAVDFDCTAYDAEFVSLAKREKVPLISTDKDLIKIFPKDVLDLKKYIEKTL